MKFEIISVFPDFFSSTQFGILGQALKSQLISINTINPREFTSDVHKTVDDRPFGGGDGMIMLFDPLKSAIEKSRTNGAKKIIYLSPQGKLLTAPLAKEIAESQHVTLVCGRYGGIDQRVINELVDEEISIGDYVLSGGEYAALVLIDVASRFVPGVLGNQDSSAEDSFENGLLEAPNFTRPRDLKDLGQVPEVLTSGHHKNISVWRQRLSYLITLQKRRDLFLKYLQSRMPQEREFLRSELKKFWQHMSESDKKVCGISLQESDFNF